MWTVQISIDMGIEILKKYKKDRNREMKDNEINKYTRKKKNKAIFLCWSRLKWIYEHQHDFFDC